MERAKVLAALLVSEYRYADAEIVYDLIASVEAHDRYVRESWVQDRLRELENAVGALRESIG